MNSSRILASCKFMMIVHDKWRQFQGMNLENPLDCKCHIDSYSLRLYCNRIKPNYILEPSSDKAPSNKRYNYLYHVLLKHDRSVDRKRRHFNMIMSSFAEATSLINLQITKHLLNSHDLKWSHKLVSNNAKGRISFGSISTEWGSDHKQSLVGGEQGVAN